MYSPKDFIIIVYVLYTIMSRNSCSNTNFSTLIGRNTFLVLALIIPVLAGLGPNFGIVVGAMAAQIAIFFVVYWGLTGWIVSNDRSKVPL
jgi:simple sugar transport system permease protein